MELTHGFEETCKIPKHIKYYGERYHIWRTIRQHGLLEPGTPTIQFDMGELPANLAVCPPCSRIGQYSLKDGRRPSFLTLQVSQVFEIGLAKFVPLTSFFRTSQLEGM